MIRPHRFSVNPETAADNAFQPSHAHVDATSIVAVQARDEFDEAVGRLTAEGVHIHVFDDCARQETPDSVVPARWCSITSSGWPT